MADCRVISGELCLWLQGRLLVADVGRGLLVALVVAERHRHLVHVHRPVQLLQRVLVGLLAHVATAVPALVLASSGAHVARKESAFVELASLVHTFLGGRVELDHHGGVHLGPGGVEGRGVQVVESRHPC